ncbi:hypothetical protein HanXRQr2_Chr16g0770491 [Helianthus annuus]|uniref:Uncharacterized protein n=1 Tax=Helianthus annuus TaxID=4232 RepID=A0A9K3H0H6_HELAN|nr:hypothetical protein HanXRQr2_Chr16g0770491 [Helianthus annuus]
MRFNIYLTNSLRMYSGFLSFWLKFCSFSIVPVRCLLKCPSEF